MKSISFVALFTLIFCFGCGGSFRPDPAPTTYVYSDWSAPENLGAVVNTTANDQHPAISPDGLSLYFASDRPGNVTGSLAATLDLWVSHRQSFTSAWEAPVNLGTAVNSPYTEFAPNLSSDGHYLYFGSERKDGCGMRDIWVSFRLDTAVDTGSGGWQTPVDLGCTVNSPQFDDGPTYFKDPTTGVVSLYLTTQNRTGGMGDFDIWYTTQKTDGTWTDPIDVAELNSPYRDTRTAIRPDGLEMYLTSNRPGSVPDSNGAPSLDLWVSTRASVSDAWGIPANVGNLVNGTANDGAPALSSDGTEMYFYSNRSGGTGANDLYVTRRTRTAIVQK